MAYIKLQDTNGTKSLLAKAQFGYDDYAAGGDKGRVYIGTGTENIPLATQAEVTASTAAITNHGTNTSNPHGVTKAQVGLGSVDNTTDLAKPISNLTQSALDGKVDNAQVQTNVPAGALFTDTETTTTLSINANVLTYTDEEGNGTDIDLNVYLDDSNLARLTSGVLDGSTGIATFSRDDNSTFDLDLSALLDDTQVTVNNTLTSTSGVEALSAAMGKTLDEKITALTTPVEW